MSGAGDKEAAPGAVLAAMKSHTSLLRKCSRHQQRPLEARICEFGHSTKIGGGRSISNPVSCKALVQSRSQTLEQAGSCHDASTPDDAFGRPAKDQ